MRELDYDSFEMIIELRKVEMERYAIKSWVRLLEISSV
jgi:hypothetical protein